MALEWKGPLRCFSAAGKCHLPQPTQAEHVVARMSRPPPKNISGEGVHVSDRTRTATAASPLFERSAGASRDPPALREIRYRVAYFLDSDKTKSARSPI